MDRSLVLIGSIKCGISRSTLCKWLSLYQEGVRKYDPSKQPILGHCYSKNLATKMLKTMSVNPTKKSVKNQGR